MLLSQLIADAIVMSAPNMAKQQAKVRQALAAFLADEWLQADASVLRQPGFALRLRQFILDAYVPADRHGKPLPETELPADQLAALRQKRQHNILYRLRGIVNDAIAQGLFPDVDIFADIPELRRQHAIRQAPQMLEQLKALLKGRSPAAQCAIDAYLLSMCLGALPLEAVPAAARGLADDGSADPRLQRLARLFLETYNIIERDLGPAPFDHIRADLDAALQRTGARLLAADLANDWACFCAQCPGSDADSQQQAVADAILSAVFPASSQPPQWVIMLTGWPDTAQEVQDRIFGCGRHTRPRNQALAQALRGNTYCPCRTKPVKVKCVSGRMVRRQVADPRRGVLRNTLFLRARRNVLQLLRREFPDVWIMRRRGTIDFVTVSDEEIRHMKSVLDLFSSVDDIDIVFDSEADGSQFQEGERVLLHHPDFGERFAAIVSHDKQKSVPGQQFYLVSFSSDNGIRFKLSMPASLLEPLISTP